MINKDKLKIFKALSEETRLLIVQELLNKERCACQLPALIKRTQSNTSMHLSKLQNLGMIKSRRDGKMVIYCLNNNKLINILRMMEEKT